MVVTTPPATRTRTAIVVPDEAAWLTWGHDLAAAGIRRVAAAERAEVLVASTLIPSALVPTVKEAWERMPPDRRLELLDAPLPGVPAAEALHGDGHHEHAADAGERGHEMHDEHEMHDGGHDMMAIVGDPSEDGLVMEAISFTLGPLAPSLPGGLVVDLSLDGDVVASATVRATLAADGAEPIPDPLAPRAWEAARAAHDGATDDTAASLARVEAERALSHAAWLRTFGTALGWAQLADAALDLARVLLPVRAGTDADGPGRRLAELLAPAAQRLRGVERLTSSGRFRRRLAGEGRLDAAQLRQHGIGGPVARACGIPADARSDDERYRRLDFEPQLADGGDALARAHVRVREIAESLRLLSALAADPAPVRSATPAASVEGPRGPLRLQAHGDRLHPRQDGSDALRELAAKAITGLELASATAVLVSFDLSPWQVGG